MMSCMFFSLVNYLFLSTSIIFPKLCYPFPIYRYYLTIISCVLAFHLPVTSQCSPVDTLPKVVWLNTVTAKNESKALFICFWKFFLWLQGVLLNKALLPIPDERWTLIMQIRMRPRHTEGKTAPVPFIRID